MSRSTLSLSLPTSITDAAVRLADEDGVSLDTWIAVAVAQKVGSVEAAAALREQRSREKALAAFDAIMARVPDNPPDPGDELPEGYARR